MCGILGLFNPSGVRATPELFATALDRLKLRGTDDEGIWQDGCVLFGHRRLAIVDLSPTGRQPMESHDGRYVIIFNGEIYNHRELRPRLNAGRAWRGTSDTETLLEAYRAWGVDCLQHINGMFAFAIWDRTERSLFVARDRVGVKPLYYFDHGGQFGFGSRPGALSALLNDGVLDIDPEALRAYLELGYVPAPLSFHRNIRKLPAGHYLLVNPRGVRRVRYWDFRSIKPEAAMRSRPEAELIEELDALIQSAVKLRLMSDVPLGAFLSGGVDSALVVAAMKTAGVGHPKAFTIAFRERAFNEGPAATRAAFHLGVDHIHETLGVESLLDLLPTYIQQYDEPFADSSAFPSMAVTRLARRHVTVALSGDGADELFGGYHYYPLIDQLAPLLRRRARTKLLMGELFWRTSLAPREAICRSPSVSGFGRVVPIPAQRRQGLPAARDSGDPGIDCEFGELVRAGFVGICHGPFRIRDRDAARYQHHLAGSVPAEGRRCLDGVFAGGTLPDDGLSTRRVGDALAAAVQATQRRDQIPAEESPEKIFARRLCIPAQDGFQRSARRMAARSAAQLGPGNRSGRYVDVASSPRQESRARIVQATSRRRA